MRRSLENRAKRLEDSLKHAQELVRTAPPTLPDWEELEEFEDAERERLGKELLIKRRSFPNGRLVSVWFLS